MEVTKWIPLIAATKACRWIERQLPVAVKIGVPLVTITVATATVLSINTISSMRRHIDNSYAAQARQLASVVQAGFTTEFEARPEDPTLINAFLQKLKHSDPSVLHIHIYRIKDGVPILWASGEPQQHLHDFEVDPEDINPILTGRESQEEEKDEGQMETTVPLKVGEQIVASVGVYTSLKPRDAAVAEITKNIISASVTGVITQVVALMFILYWAVLHRVARLSRASSRVAAGDMTVYLPEGKEPRGQDEIIHVAREFDCMIDAIKSRTYQQTALVELGQHALAKIDLNEFMNTAVKLLTEILQVECSGVFKLIPNRQKLLLYAGVGWKEVFLGHTTLEVELDSQLGYTLLTNEPVVVDDQRTENRFRVTQLLPDHIVSSISVRIADHEQPFGILILCSTRQRIFSKDEILFVKAVANLLSTAIERKRSEVALVRAEAAEAAKQELEKEVLERQRIAEQLRNALEKEKELSELKSRFVSMTSHEFRTPLTTILSSAELLQDCGSRWTEEKKLQHIQRIVSTVKHMTQLLSDVLLIGKTDAGKLELKPAPLDLAQFCRDLVEEMQLGTDTHTIIFCSEANSTNACMDEKLLRHILYNLLSNAIKYSPQGGTVHFHLLIQQEKAIFRIKDEGIGIPPAEQSQLFNSFHRASNVGTIPGTGLGLAIVKKSVDLHGGKITVTSEVGAGTTFTVTIPFISIPHRVSYGTTPAS